MLDSFVWLYYRTSIVQRARAPTSNPGPANNQKRPFDAAGDPQAPLFFQAHPLFASTHPPSQARSSAFIGNDTSRWHLPSVTTWYRRRIMRFFGLLLVAAAVVLALNACGTRTADRAASGPSIVAVQSP